MRRFGLLGKTLKHSFSRGYFTEKFRQASIDAVYENFEIPSIDLLPALLQKEKGLEGLNVTIPYKEAVIPYLHQIDATVEAVGACNCIRISNGILAGYNTDVKGFILAIKGSLRPWHNKALVLGSGGAAKAVRHGLEKLGIATLTVSRSGAGLPYESLDASIMEQYLLVINTTPLGMFPDAGSFPPIPYHLLGPEHFLFDLTYNPAQTVFLARGAARGAQVQNGYDMLVAQAAESWAIWNA